MATQQLDKARPKWKMPEYSAWSAMKGRCSNQKHPWYHRYGGRGVKVCDLWKSSFDAFLNDIGHRPSNNHSLERIDNDGDYEPGNVRWATKKEQARNRANNMIITLSGQKMLLLEATAITNTRYDAVSQRIRRGWDAVTAIETPIRKYAGEKS